ncbi:MAG: serine hydrolase domain-containing protein [Phycisphaerae bacterium]
MTSSSTTARNSALSFALVAAVVGTLATVTVAADSPIVKGDVGQALDEYLTRLSRLGFSGSAIVARNSDVILQKGYGLADRERNRPVTTNTIFTIGSITKQFTGAAILKLEMMGKLSVEDPIAKYFDNVPAGKRGATLHHLLTHTAGLPDALGDDFGDQATSNWLIEEAMASELLWEPGTRYHYSNVGFSLLGIIIEKVSGMGYERFLREHLFKPAGMSRTGYVLPRYSKLELAVGYRNDSRWGTILERPMLNDGPNWNLRANGGIHSTPAEMYKWHQALLGESILSAQAKRKYFGKHADEGGGQSFYGYGWSIATTPWGTPTIQHNGGNGIFSADCRRYVGDGLFVFVCTNLSAFSPPDPISEQLARIALGKPHSMPPKTVRLSANDLKPFIGDFRFADGGQINVAARGAGLALTGADPDAADLLAGRLSRSDPRVRELSNKTEHIIGDWMNGDYKSLLALWGGRMAPDEVRDALEGVRERRTADLGAFRDVSSTSCEQNEDDLIVTARVRHAKQSGGIEIVWREGKIAMIGMTDRGSAEARPAQVFPIGDGRFESFSLQSPGNSTRVEFENPGDGAPAGSLVLHIGERTLKATRIE